MIWTVGVKGGGGGNEGGGGRWREWRSNVEVMLLTSQGGTLSRNFSFTMTTMDITWAGEAYISHIQVIIHSQKTTF